MTNWAVIFINALYLFIFVPLLILLNVYLNVVLNFKKYYSRYYDDNIETLNRLKTNENKI